MFARASISVSAGSDFVVEGAVDLVGFRAKDAGEVVGHSEVVCVVRWGRFAAEKSKVSRLEVGAAERVALCFTASRRHT